MKSLRYVLVYTLLVTLLRRHSHQRERWSTKRKMTTYHLFVACIGSNDDDASYRSIPFDAHVFFVHPRR